MRGRILILAAVTVAISPVQALAGFEFGGSSSSANQQAITISNMPDTPSYVAPSVPGEPEPLKKASRPESDPSAPALQVYDERYIPDSIKSKYKLTDSWYGDGMSSPGALNKSDIAAQPQPDSFIVDDGTQVPVNAQTSPIELSAVKPYERLQSWRARKGEPVREILKRWSSRENTELMWASPDDPILQKDFSHVGSLESAVAALIRSTGKDLYTQYRSDGLTPVMMSQASTITATVPQAQTTPSAVPLDVFKPKSTGKGVETRWFALSGASLAEVLEVWAEDEGATLVWEAGTNYALKDSVSQTGRFEDAVFKALSQFDNDQMRPVGQLYADPATGQKVLLIRTDTPS